MSDLCYIITKISPSMSSIGYILRLDGRFQKTSLPVLRSNSKPCHGHTRISRLLSSVMSPGPQRVPRTADDTLADGCALVRAAVHHGTKFAAVQTNYADFAPVELDEFHLADGEVAGAANLESLSFSRHGCLVALQPKCTGSVVEEHGLACAGLQHS